MFRAGDEFMHTQAGNNNPYNQDNETAWIDWSRLRANPDIFRFLMIAFRKAHPSLATSRFWREHVHWYGVGRDTDLSFDSRSLAFAIRQAMRVWQRPCYRVATGATREHYASLTGDL